MKLLIACLLGLSLSALADGLPGVEADTYVEGATKIAKKFCLEDHSDAKADCDAWRKGLEASLENQTIIKSVCIKLTDLSIGSCRQMGSLAGLVIFVK